ncbi:uncharacterized protein LOC118262371 isoform X2 [Spodoptera frugiperda]|uniref:Small RNA 2'-O-methyltransferase n=1 Tax=Spodoptera frugiperda TaxID=7108 RepID=A0A9R0DUL9_SPOFR|nr:uncharacterized protein LOC118262371 isoform X2 [Spodoptera frugiperda]
MIVALQTLVFFRESLLSALDSLLRPYYKHLTLAFTRSGNVLEDEESDDQVFAEYDDEKGVVFFPPMYAQRYAAVSDWLMDDRWCGKLEKVVDFGHHDMSFIKYLKEVPGIRYILGVDIETIPLRCSSDLLGGDEYSPKRESPLQVTLFQGNAADPDYRLIGCDAVVAIEMIEHMLPHDLERLVHTVFGFIKPWIVIFTTPNADFNVLFKALEKNGLRRMDHFFEWTREQFNDWCSNIVVRYPNYTVTCQGIGPGPPGTLHLGCCSQLSLFISKNYHKQADLNINSLALVENAPSPNNFSDLFGCCDSSVGTRQEVERGTSRTKQRLNCSTLQVKKFSKTTQNLMAKNKIDSLVHTREVVDEIRHLTKTLNFNKFSRPEDGSHIWNNINWGDNAPYWNQYYKIVRECIYPFEAKSEEARMLDLISEEINRLIDMQYDEEFSVDVNRLEIPLTQLMTVVHHITTDIDRVRDLLEWNGYEVVNDVVIHSRLVVDNTSVATHDEDWPDNETLSDWDTDLYSTSMSVGSTIIPDLPGRCLRRALDEKVRSLRRMLSADEDITTELDRVVCRLMRLALHSSRGRQTPPPSRWMQCKLLDLLTLTEKAIGRRKKQFIENYPILAIEDAKPPDVELDQDTRIKEIVEKYRYILQPIEKTITDGTNGQNSDVDIMEDECLSTTSNEFLKDYEYAKDISPSLVIPEPVFSTENFKRADSPHVEENPLERTKAWLDDDIEDTSFPEHEVNYENISSGDTDHSLTNTRHKLKKASKRQKINKKDSKEFKADSKLSSPSKVSSKFKIKRDDKHKKKNGNTKNTKKIPKKKPNYSALIKNQYSSSDYDSYPVQSKRKSNENQSFNVSATKPIPESLIELCHPELKADKGGQPRPTTTNIADISHNIVTTNRPSCDIAATEESCLVDIVMQDFEETIALRRTVGTDAEEKPVDIKDDVDSLNNDFDETLCLKHEVSTENVQSQTIFLNDINEPSTSKGIRHNISTDVQCGPDTFATYSMLSASTSLVKIPPVFTAGVKINEVTADTKMKGTDFGTSTQDTNTTTLTPRLRSVGIKIKDSDVNLNAKTESYNRIESCTMTVQDSILQTPGTYSYCSRRGSDRNSIISSPETRMLKVISSNLKTEDSGSEFWEPSIASSSKTRTFFVNASLNASQVMVKSAMSKDVIIEACSSKDMRPRLCCGGVHVHSFKEQESSEDVVYQGQWQRHKPKACARKKSRNFIPLRKANESAAKKNRETLKAKGVSSKEKVVKKRQEKKQTDAETTKPVQVRHKEPNKLTREENSQTMKPSVTSTKKLSNTAKKMPKPVKTFTKVASKLGTSVITKNTKSTFTVKKPTILSNAAVKKDNDKPQKLKKTYIPLYLRLRRGSLLSDSDKENLNQNIDSACESISENKNSVMEKKVPINKWIKNDIEKDLLKFSNEVRENVSYYIFRNELENNVESPEDLSSGSTVTHTDHNKSTPRPLETVQRSHSPQSMNSSTCSSLNSVATVRAATTRNKNMTHRRHSASSYKSNLTTNSDSDSAPTMKKINKRCKSGKKTENKDVINTESVPESTQNLNKSAFNSKHKSVYIAQIKTEGSPPPNTVSRHKTQIANKSNIKIATRKDSDEKHRANDPTVSKKKSVKSDTSSVYEDFITNQSDSFESSDSANMVLVLEPQVNYDNIMDMQNHSPVRNERTADCDVDPISHSVPEWVQNSSLHSHASSIRDSMRRILEDTLDLIIWPDEHNVHHLDSKTVILSREQNHTAREDKDDPLDVKVPAEPVGITQFLENDIETALNRTFDTVRGDESATVSLNDTSLTIADLDMLSFDSIISVSKYSEFFMADNELSLSLESEQAPTILAQNTTSVRDLFERKEPHMIQNTPGALAVQAFSGFSLDVEPVAGDQPDPIALIDSETGSPALGIARQATSEELFISGRSSDSYESCLIDDDTVVPNWLFQLLSQQQSVEEDQQPVLVGPADALPNEPMYDANGNVIEPAMIGVGAGAGDGRGMHSDHSQDSSGRGTSLSSSDTSSGPQSEVSTILIDPAFTTPFDLLRDPLSSSAVLSTEAHSSDRTYRIDSDLRDDRTRILNGASDVDADVSSIDTDVPDLSDN